MTRLTKIFDVFSKRPDANQKRIHAIPKTTRTRIFLWCKEVFGYSPTIYSTGDYLNDFWEEIQKILHTRHGRIPLFNGPNPNKSFRDDVLNFLYSCKGEEFLDFIEYIFRVECLQKISRSANELVTEINELLPVDNLPYYLTDFIVEKVPAIMPGIPNNGKSYRINIISYPKIILRENEVIHQKVTIPVLNLLQKPLFENANKEYLEALEDYRKDDCGDCLTKCGSAFESVMKILCDKNNWKYNKTDTAAPLVKIMIEKLNIDSYFTDVLTIIATLRNKRSKSHGAGTDIRIAKRSQAEYALNTTASAILFLAAEAGERS